MKIKRDYVILGIITIAVLGLTYWADQSWIRWHSKITISPTPIASQPEQEPNEPEVVFYESAVAWDADDYVTLAPCTSISISPPDGNEVTIDWSSGEVVVTGANEAGAKMFFEAMVKPLMDEYLRNDPND